MIAFYDHFEHGYRWEVDGKVVVAVYTHPSEIRPAMAITMARLIDEHWELRLA